MGWGIVAVGFIIYNIQYLNLPCYWDEAWSYQPAVEEMVRKGASLVPGSISIANYKGHPLFFYFISSAWLQLFQNSIVFSRIFALSISVLTLLYTFLLANLLTERKTAALLSVIFLAVQDIFLAQAGMLLPEMLLALLTLMSLFYYFKHRYWLFFISASLLMLTKETGTILIISILFCDILYFILRKEGDFHRYLSSKYPLFLSFVPVIFFFIYQKIKIGWFFYPEHIGYLDFSPHFFSKINGYSSFLFLFQGRNAATITLLVLVLFKVIKTKRLKVSKACFTLLVFILFYLVFLSVNFYSTRYTLSLIPVFSILSIWGVYSLMENEFLSTILGFVFIIFSVVYVGTRFKDSDTNIGYRNDIRVQKEMVKFCENQHMYKSRIATHFLMAYDLSHPQSGYLSGRKVFSHIENKADKNTEYVIISSNEQNKMLHQQMDTLPVRLIKRFTEKQAWCKLYKIIPMHGKDLPEPFQK